MIARQQNQVLLVLAFLSTLTGCNDGDSHGYQGYIEGEYLYLAVPQAGYLKSLDLQRGHRVTAGQTVFVVSEEPDFQALEQAQSRAESSQFKLDNLKQPRRKTEIASLQANLKAAQAQQLLSQIQLQQQQQLIAKHYVAQIKLDEARSAHEQAIAQVEALKKQIATYENTLGRQGEIQAAEADLMAAVAETEQKRWALATKTATAPITGEISETYFHPGEWVPAGAAVASLLPDSQRKLRFFIPEMQLAAVNIGDRVEGRCDGCSAPISAQINFIAAQAEYTPPVIYSRGSREKLVFRVEAIPSLEQARQLRPGLPVDVSIMPKT
jgi:HlyD family secretion protein